MLISLKDLRVAQQPVVYENGHVTLTLEQPERHSPVRPPRQAVSGLPIEYLYLGLALRSIPHPAGCSFCGSPRQREFLDYEVTTSSIVYRALEAPGYGCTGCEIKTYHPAIAVKALRAAACKRRHAGDISESDRLESEATWIQQSSPMVTLKKS